MTTELSVRRRWFGQVLASGVLGLACVRLAQAGSTPVIHPGVNALEGELRVNGQRVGEGATVQVGDTLETGADGYAVVVVEQSAYLLHAAGRMRLQAAAGARPTVELERGRLLSVFEPGPRTLRTPTAIVGVRGTGLYLEAAEERSYVCLCYGEAELTARHDPGIREWVSTTHHEAPRSITREGADWIGRRMPMRNHTDAELIMLESLVGRRPPFADDPFLSEY